MTKRLLIATVFLSAALFFSIFSFVYLEKTSDMIISSIDALSEKENLNEEDVNALVKLWDKNKQKFAIFLKHTDADTLDRYFLVLEQSVLQNDRLGAERTLRELSAFLRVTVDGEKVKIENIF